MLSEGMSQMCIFESNRTDIHSSLLLEDERVSRYELTGDHGSAQLQYAWQYAWKYVLRLSRAQCLAGSCTLNNICPICQCQPLPLCSQPDPLFVIYLSDIRAIWYGKIVEKNSAYGRNYNGSVETQFFHY